MAANASAPANILIWFNASLGDICEMYYGLGSTATTPVANPQRAVLLYPSQSVQSQEVRFQVPYSFLKQPVQMFQRLEWSIGAKGGGGVTFSSLQLYFAVITANRGSKPVTPADGWRYTIGSRIGK